MGNKTTTVSRNLSYPDLMKLLHLVGQRIGQKAPGPKNPHWDRKKAA